MNSGTKAIDRMTQESLAEALAATKSLERIKYGNNIKACWLELN